LTKDEHKVNTNTRQLFEHKYIYMPLVGLWQKRESNSETYASESDALQPSYPQVLRILFCVTSLAHRLTFSEARIFLLFLEIRMNIVECSFVI